MVATQAKDEAREKARRAIIRTLSNHPGITRSMLSTATRPYLPTSTEWAGLLDEMIDEGTVVSSTRLISQGRAQVVFTLSSDIQKAERIAEE